MRFCIPFLVLFSIISMQCAAQSTGNVSHYALSGDELILTVGTDLVVFRPIGTSAVMVNYRPNGIEDPDTLVVDRAHWPKGSASIDTSGDPIVISGSDYSLKISRSPFHFRLLSAAGSLLCEVPTSVSITAGQIDLAIKPSKYYGVHNRETGSLSTNGGELSSGAQGEAGAPFVWTPDGWGFLADADGGTLTCEGTSLKFTRPASPGARDLKIFLLAGPPRSIFSALRDVSGAAPLFPKFTFGFINTEWGIDQTELLNDIATYRAKGIPLDAYVLDFDWMDWGSDNYGEFRWGPKFPAAQADTLVRMLASTGVKLMGIRKPRVHLGTVQGTLCRDSGYFHSLSDDYFSHKQVGRVDFHKPAARHWYWDAFVRQHSYARGMIGYWNDEADEYGGNLMFMQMQRAEYEGQRASTRNRVWSLNRNFYLGAQRYAYGHWSGDIRTGFGPMADQRLFMLSSIVLGSAWWGMDIGGFKRDTLTPENYYRWVQFGSVVPIFRVHGSLNVEREPWQYGAEAETLATAAIKLRYRLLPYIYSAAWENHRTGWPLARPLIMDYPAEPSFSELCSEWMFGPSLLAAPVVEKGAVSTTVTVPPGTWFDFHTGAPATGPATITVPVTHQTLPLYVKAGSVLPTAPVGRYADAPETRSTLILSCYPGGSGSCNVYEDDGMTYDYENGLYAQTHLEHTQNASTAVLAIGARTGPWQTPPRDYVAEFNFLMLAPSTVLIDGAQAPYAAAVDLAPFRARGWTFDVSTRRCIVKLPDDGRAHRIELTFPAQ